MKVLVVSHSYVVGINQQKIQRLAEMPGISVALVVPEKWRDMGRDIPLQHPTESAFRLYPIKVFWHNHLYVYFFGWFQFLKVFIKEQPDLVYIEEEPQSFSAFQAILLARLFRIKIILLTWENLPVKFSFYKRLLAWWNIRKLDAAVGGTGEALQMVRELGFEKEGFVNPQFGLDEVFFRPADAGPLKAKLGLDNKFVIGFVARLTKEKGVLTLLRAAAQMPFDYTLLIVGNGPVKEQAVQLAVDLGIENKVKWGGIISHFQLSEYMNCFDLFVLPSIPSSTWKEQFGHVVIEAMSCQIPVIGSDCGAIPELIGDGGLIFPAGDETRLAGHIKTLHDDPGLREKLGLKGRQRVIQNYSDSVIVKRLYEIITEVYKKAESKT